MAIVKTTYGYLTSETSECDYEKMLKACFPKNHQRRFNLLLSDVFKKVSEDRYNQIWDYITYNCSNLDYIYKTIIDFRKKASLPSTNKCNEIDRAIIICELDTLYIFDIMIFHKLYNYLVENKIIDDRY